MRNFNGIPYGQNLISAPAHIAIGSLAANTSAQATIAANTGRGAALRDFTLACPRAALEAGIGFGQALFVSAANAPELDVVNTTAGALPAAAFDVDLMFLPETARQFNGRPFAKNAIAIPLTVAQNAVLANSGTVVTVACPGAVVGDAVVVRARQDLELGYECVGARVSAANVVSAYFMNVTAGNLPAAAAGQLFDVMCLPRTLRRFNGLPVPTNPQATPLTLAQNAIAANTTGVATVAVPGAVVGDFVLLIPRVALDVGGGVAAARVSAANTVSATFINTTAIGWPANPAGIAFDAICLNANQQP